MEKDTTVSAVSDGMLNRVAGLKLIANVSDMENQLASSLAEVKSLKAQLNVLKEERLVDVMSMFLGIKIGFYLQTYCASQSRRKGSTDTATERRTCCKSKAGGGNSRS